MKTLRIISYAGLVAIAIMLLVTMCAILQDSVISHRAHRQELTAATLSIATTARIAPARIQNRE